MNFDPPKISPLGQRAVIVELGRIISEDLNALAIGLATYLEQNPFPGFVEAAPAYSSVYVGYDPHVLIAKLSPPATAFECVASCVREALSNIEIESDRPAGHLEIPVSFGGEHGPDLAFVAKANSLSETEVIEIFTASSYRVYMLGFLPGFAYLGELDPRIATARRATPRTRVVKGSIGIADRQTGIYPAESPGGWQLIGRTEVEMFLPDLIPPCRIKPGDYIQFNVA